MNRNSKTKCLNICYTNSIIQCPANAAPFVQWVLNNDFHGKCKFYLFKEVTSQNESNLSYKW